MTVQVLNAEFANAVGLGAGAVIHPRGAGPGSHPGPVRGHISAFNNCPRGAGPPIGIATNSERIHERHRAVCAAHATAALSLKDVSVFAVVVDTQPAPSTSCRGTALLFSAEHRAQNLSSGASSSRRNSISCLHFAHTA